MAEAAKRLIVNSDRALVECDKALYDLFREHKYLSISVRLGRDRSAEQNSLWAAIYKRIARDTGWEFKHARAHCKWYHGIPILQRDAEGFDESFQRIFGQLTEEHALRLMNANKLFPVDGFPVTRNFSTRQGAEYTDLVVDEFRGQGVYFDDLLKESKA